MFESRSTPPGGRFLGPPSPFPPSAQGSGFPPGVHASPRGQVPPWVRTSRPASRLLPSSPPCFPGTGGQGPGHPPYFPHCFHGTGGQGQAFRGPGFRSASMLSGGQGQGFLHAFRRQGFQAFRRPCFPRASRGPGIFELFFFAASAPSVFASQPPGFHAFRRQGPDFPPGFRGPCFQVTGDQGPGPGLPALASHT